MTIFYPLGFLILLLVNYALQQDSGDNASPELIRTRKAEVEGGDQTTWILKNGVSDNFPGPPFSTDDVYVRANLGGNAEKNIAAAAATVDNGRPPEAQDVVQDCQIDDASRAPARSRTRRRQNNSDKPLICPAKPAPPSSQQEEKKPGQDSSNSQSGEEEKPDPWLFENQERRRLIPQFGYNSGICSGKDYGYTRVIPVCDSGIDFFRTFIPFSMDWNLKDVRPCRSKIPTSSPFHAR